MEKFMSTPAKNADTQDKSASEDKELTFSDRVDEALAKATKDDKGNLILPEDLDEAVAFGAMSEKRRRDTQNSFTTLAQKAKALEAEKSILLGRVAGDATVQLTQAQVDELEELKFSDPEAWRKKLNSYESEAKTKRVTEINEELKKASTSTLADEEIERRKGVMADFNKKHPDFKLDDDVIASDIPPRITRSLADGKISFEQFLEDCYEYSTTGKVVKQEQVHSGPNLSKVSGGPRPDNNAVKEDAVTSYTKEIY